MEYKPPTPQEKREWINWLENQVNILNDKPANIHQNDIFQTDNGDINTAKDIVGILLATLKQETVIIN